MDPKYYIKRIDENGATKYAYCDWTGVDPKWRFSPALALAYPFCSPADAARVAVALPVDVEIVSAHHVRAGK